MKTLFKIALTASLICAGSACDADEGLAEREAKDIAADLTGGEAEHAHTTIVDEIPAWEVEVAMSNGATIEVKLDKNTGELLVLEDKAGPFDYELDPLGSALSYGEIAGHATTEVPGDIVAWELEREASGEYKWEFYVRDAEGQLWEMFLSPDDGTVTDIEAKDAVD